MANTTPSTRPHTVRPHRERTALPPCAVRPAAVRHALVAPEARIPRSGRPTGCGSVIDDAPWAVRSAARASAAADLPARGRQRPHAPRHTGLHTELKCPTCADVREPV